MSVPSQAGRSCCGKAISDAYPRTLKEGGVHMSTEAAAAETIGVPKEKRAKKKKKLSFPTAFTILFVLTIIAVIATWFVPAGQYAKL